MFRLVFMGKCTSNPFIWIPLFAMFILFHPLFSVGTFYRAFQSKEGPYENHMIHNVDNTQNMECTTNYEAISIIIIIIGLLLMHLKLLLASAFFQSQNFMTMLKC